MGRGVELTAFVPRDKWSRPAFVFAPPVLFAPLQNMFSDRLRRKGEIG